jgi:hypothetical protein
MPVVPAPPRETQIPLRLLRFTARSTKKRREHGAKTHNQQFRTFHFFISILQFYSINFPASSIVFNETDFAARRAAAGRRLSVAGD